MRLFSDGQKWQKQSYCFLNLNCREFPDCNSSRVVLGCYRGQISSTKQMDLHNENGFGMLFWTLISIYTLLWAPAWKHILISCFSETCETTSSHAHTLQAPHWVCDNFKSLLPLYFGGQNLTNHQVTADI